MRAASSDDGHAIAGLARFREAAALAAVVAAILSSGACDPWGTRPTDIAGTYNLTHFLGSPLPTAVAQGVQPTGEPCADTLFGQTLSLGTDHHSLVWTSQTAGHCPGTRLGAGLSLIHRYGTYLMRGDSLFLQYSPPEPQDSMWMPLYGIRARDSLVMAAPAGPTGQAGGSARMILLTFWRLVLG